MINNRSYGCKKGTAYRTVLSRIINLAEKDLLELYPNKSRQERIILAQEEPLFTACKQLRSPTKEEWVEFQSNTNVNND